MNTKWIVLPLILVAACTFSNSHEFALVDTGQTTCYDDSGRAIDCPARDAAFAGQDAQCDGVQPSYVDNGDGTITDLRTGLMWQQNPGDKMTWTEARDHVSAVHTGGYTDWRLPTIKELYSLIDFSGSTSMSASRSVPYIDTDFFAFRYGDESAGERFIDAQYASATEYVGTTMLGAHTIFGVNFADGRIKGYPTTRPDRSEKTFFVLYVRQGKGAFENDFVDNENGTITDRATGLLWSATDSGFGMDWKDALAWIEQKNTENFLGYSDWRLPNAKEMQSIVDYSRSPQTTGSAAIDPVFKTSQLDDGEYPYFWTSTTHLDGPPHSQGDYAVYISFGSALGYMEIPPGSGQYHLLDVHGAGAQRSDPKTGDPSDYPYGHGPQGDIIRIFNYVRPVRDAKQPVIVVPTS